MQSYGNSVVYMKLHIQHVHTVLNVHVKSVYCCHCFAKSNYSTSKSVEWPALLATSSTPIRVSNHLVTVTALFSRKTRFSTDLLQRECSRKRKNVLEAWFRPPVHRWRNILLELRTWRFQIMFNPAGLMEVFISMQKVISRSSLMFRAESG